MAIQKAGIEPEKTGVWESTEHEHWGNWSVWSTHVPWGWQEIKLCLGTGTKSVRALKARLKNLGLAS